MPARSGTISARPSFPATGEVISGICPTFGPASEPRRVRSTTPCMSATSVGVGLIWDSPFGPLRFDYAFPLTKEPYDRIQQFRFGGGTKF